VPRLRKRYKAILREWIATTVDDPDEAEIIDKAEINDEIRDPFAAFEN
jgi:hypothetical protein